MLTEFGRLSGRVPTLRIYVTLLPVELISYCLLRRAADWARVGETPKCWEVVDVPLHSDVFVDAQREWESLAFPLASLCLQDFHRRTSFLEKVCAGELCVIVQQ